jgi:hypothetical protein
MAYYTQKYCNGWKKKARSTVATHVASAIKHTLHVFLQRGSNAVRPMSQICGMLKNTTTTAAITIVG